MTVYSSKLCSKLGSAFLRRIYSIHKCIFEYNPSSRDVGIMLGGSKQLGHSVAMVNGHKLIAYLIVRRMKGDAERNMRSIFNEAVDFGNYSAG